MTKTQFLYADFVFETSEERNQHQRRPTGNSDRYLTGDPDIVKGDPEVFIGDLKQIVKNFEIVKCFLMVKNPI